MHILRYLILFFLAATALFYLQKANALDKLIYNYPCELAIRYRIDTIDSRFNLSRQDVLDVSQNAASIWNKLYGKTLFTYDPQGELSINLVFDARQALTNEYERLKDELQKKENEIEPQIAEFKRRVASFNERSKKLSDEIAYWNNQGGAPPKEFDRLVAEQESLQSEAAELNEMSRSLNQSTDLFNSSVYELNRTVGSLNTALSQRPEEGIYKGSENRIEVYFNNNRSELIRTIAHEMGHARDMGHAKDPKAIMYSTTTDFLTPADEDKNMLEKVCRKQNKLSLLKEQLRFLFYEKSVK